jgi:uncharacterized protein YlxW (UPF0749 family)
LQWRRKINVLLLRWPTFAISASFAYILSSLLKKFPCWLINLSLRYSGGTTQAATDKLSLKPQVDGLVADNSLLKTKVNGLAAKVTQLKANQAMAQELLDKCQAEAEWKEKSLQRRLQTTINSLRSESIPCLCRNISGYASLLMTRLFP